MARILPYSSDVSPDAGIPSRRALPQDAGNAGLSDLGEGLQKTGDTLYDVAQTQETADVYSALAAKRSQWTNELHNRAATTPAGDPNFADNFTRDFGDDIGQMGNNVATRGARLALQRGQAELTSELVSKAGVFQVQSAGVKARVDYQSVLNANRNTVYNDPSQFDSVLRDTQKMLDDPSGPYVRIPADTRAELGTQTRSSIALSAFQGTARQDPQQALTDLQAGRWDQYLVGNERNAAENFANRVQHGYDAQQRADDNAQKRADEAKWDDIGKGFLKQLNSIDPQTPALTAQDIMFGAGKDLPAHLQEHWINMLDRAQKPDPLSKISQATSTDLFRRIHLSDGNPQKITNDVDIDNSYIAGNLNRTDHDWLIKQAGDARTDDGQRLGKTQSDFLSSFKPQIDKSNPLMGKIDQTGMGNFYVFSRYVDDTVKQYRDAGKSPYDLFNPSKPDFLGAPKAIEGFQKTIEESVKTVQQSFTRKPAADRKPLGEIFK